MIAEVSDCSELIAEKCCYTQICEVSFCKLFIGVFIVLCWQAASIVLFKLLIVDKFHFRPNFSTRLKPPGPSGHYGEKLFPNSIVVLVVR